MSVTYDRLSTTDELAAIAWWATAFDDDPAIIASAFRSDAQRFTRSFTAQAPDGTLAAAIAFWIRLIRDAAGQPRRVAHLWGIGTPGDVADLERQQHVDQLVALALNAAQHDHCEFALFYPAPETYAHHEARGWQLFPNQYRQGRFSGVQLASTPRYTIRSYDPTREPQGMVPLVEIYQAYNVARPASVVRDKAYWEEYLRWRWGEWSMQGTSIILVATPVRVPERPCGYIIPKYYDDAFIIAEIGAAPSATEVLPMLMTGVLEEATRRGIADRFRVYFPYEPQIDGWAHQLFTPAPQQGNYGAHAVYPLQGITAADLSAMFTALGRHSWLLDQF